MCGLVALIAKRQAGFFSPDQDIFKQMLYADAVRGWDATGVFGVTKGGNIDVKKQAVAAGSFLLNPSYKEFDTKLISSYKMVIGHNRKATHGEKKDKDSHPFWSENEKIVLVHNGMISNHKEFCKQSEVDSNAICQALSTTDDPKKVIAKITGAFAFIWYNTDEKKLYFIRNDARPLHLVETAESLAIVSEADLAKWIFHRNNKPVTSIVTVEPMKLYSITLGENKINMEGSVQKETAFFPHKNPPINAPFLVSCQPPKKIGGLPTTTEPSKDLIELDENCFITEDDIPTIEQAQEQYKIGTKIAFNIDTYDEQINTKTGEITYRIIGTPLNVTSGKILIKFFLQKEAFTISDFTAIQFSTIRGSVINNGILSLYVSSPIELQGVTTTHNNIQMSKNHMNSGGFPDKCDLCQTSILYTQLSNMWVEFKDGYVKNCYCPQCTKRYHYK